MDRCSVYRESRDEAERHKWIESQHAGRDLGEVAIRQWVQQHWNGFLRARWLEHLEGKHTLDETIDLVKLRTRQYARRQLTWFRHQAQAEWVDANKALTVIEHTINRP